MRTPLTIVGNLTADLEPRFVPSGAAVANFTVTVTLRSFDKQKNEWVDGEAAFWRCNIWREAAENVTESLHRGDRVIVTGEVKARSYETKEGENRAVLELEVEEVGPALRYATAQVTRPAAAVAGSSNPVPLRPRSRRQRPGRAARSRLPRRPGPAAAPWTSRRSDRPSAKGPDRVWSGPSSLLRCRRAASSGRCAAR